MGLGKFHHPQLVMEIPVVSNCYHGDGSGESMSNGDLPIAWQDEADREGRQRYDGSAAYFCWVVRYCPMKCYPIRRPGSSNSLQPMQGEVLVIGGVAPF
jgi:hypothetical protein